MVRKNDDSRPSKPPVPMPSVKTLALLQEQIAQISHLERLRRENDELTPWRERTLSLLRLVFGEPSGELERFQRIDFAPNWHYPGMPESDYQESYNEGFKRARATLEGIRFEYESAHDLDRRSDEPKFLPEAGAMATSQFYFVAHEFSAGQLDDLRKAVQDALRDTGLEPYFADKEIIEGQIFLNKILPKIGQSRFGIYDISNPAKPNVFIELGAALALGCRYYIIVREGVEIPSDLQGLDRIQYHSFEHLKAQLREKIKA
jgi:hypothetical protein